MIRVLSLILAGALTGGCTKAPEPATGTHGHVIKKEVTATACTLTYRLPSDPVIITRNITVEAPNPDHPAVRRDHAVRKFALCRGIERFGYFKVEDLAEEAPSAIP